MYALCGALAAKLASLIGGRVTSTRSRNSTRRRSSVLRTSTSTARARRTARGSQAGDPTTRSTRPGGIRSLKVRLHVGLKLFGSARADLAAPPRDS